MAKATTRVHLLANELGVKSKAIIEKCQAEGLDQVKNHMSTISAGLAATIREWFSEGEHETTVEVTKRVDLKKVRVKRKKKEAPPEPSEAAPVEGAAAPTEPAAEEPAETPAAPAVEASSAEVQEAAPAAEPEETSGPESVEPPAEEQPVTPEPVQTEAAAPVEPKKPEPIKPAGPMVAPKPAKLSGPTVVRVEKAEPDTHPKRRRPARPRHDEPMTEPLMPAVAGPAKSKKAGKAKTHGRKKDTVVEEERPRANVKRMRARDIEERQARLAAARGESLRSKPSRRIESKRAEDGGAIERPEKADDFRADYGQRPVGCFGRESQRYHHQINAPGSDGYRQPCHRHGCSRTGGDGIRHRTECRTQERPSRGYRAGRSKNVRTRI